MSSDDGVHTICPYCGVGCGLRLERDGEEGDVTISPWFDAPVNEGALCVKGGASTEVVAHEDRLTEPLIRDDGEFRSASWDEALEVVVAELERIREEHGPDAMGFFGSSKVMNEENYLLQKLARRYGTNNVDNCTRMCHASTVYTLRNSLGAGAMTNSMDDLRDHADVFWVQGANPAEQHVITHSHYVRPALREGATLIQVDPHANKTTTDADVHLQLEPGTDIPLLNVVLKTIIDEGWVDDAFVDARTTGVDHLKATLADVDVETAAETCGVPLEEIREAARIYATADNAAIFTGMGMSQHRCGVDNVQNEVNLALLTGNVGRPGTGVNPLRGQNNVQGTCDVGAMPNVLPGYREVDDEAARSAVEDVWGFEVPAEPGLTNVEITHAAGESVAGLYVMGENPVMSEPDSSAVEDRLEELEFVVVQDIFMTETAAFADVVLPATSWAERGGTVTNTDRRVQLMRPATAVPGNTRHDLDILRDVGTRLFGDPDSSDQTTTDSGFDFDGPEAVFEELREVAPIYHGITYERLGLEGVQWPCYEEGDAGDQYLYAESFDTEDGLGVIRGVRHTEPAEGPDETYPLILTTARLEEHYNTGTMSTRSPTLRRRTPENFVDIHPDDAADRGIEDGDYVTLRTRRGEIVLEANVTEAIKQGSVWTTPHFSDARANTLTNDVLDPLAKIPEYKAAAVEVEPTASE
ncbi:formate dehydrogenase subunit alpha [Natronorubrum sulfidifaciens]|uniref:Formate dehydrogenase subunit alpha n=1 Tax=Natronorubrum sulfidifaciens JCM 14089 TaxID=1230460 RepID=L9VXZ4_9EURY|nr:formate dehydrogenase subunit alpha [Natronorubrum sulfidifaciens]ELY42029.1 formate dehydrogenase subunit alpha [Natronorubrum sulfidifaciens JCM 14089]